MSESTPLGVLLVQLGTPDQPTPEAVRRFLAEFLSDRRVVDLPRWRWWPILHGIVLRTRPRRSAAAYRRVWTDEGSPLLVHSEALRRGLATRLGDAYRVELGMRYGCPPIRAALDRLATLGCREVVVLPLFPQYGTSTTASAEDAVAAWSKGREDAPALPWIRSFPDHPAWIAALAAEVSRAGVEPRPDAPLLLSFHGIPERYAARGDPYPRECEATAHALAERLELAEGSWRLVYQSRFGREPWLGPYLDETLAALPGEGVRSVAVATPSFVADCLETIDEVGLEGRETFLGAGGEAYVRVPSPNASPEMVAALAALVAEHAPGR